MSVQQVVEGMNMDDTGSLNPWLFEIGFFFLRCGVPLLITFGLSYLVRRLGLVAPPPKPPQPRNNNHAANAETTHVNS